MSTKLETKNEEYKDPIYADLLHALQAFRRGDFSVRLPDDWIGIEGKIADSFNEIVSANEQLADELRRVAHDVGKKGLTSQRVRLGNFSRSWNEMEDIVNTLIDDLSWPTTAVIHAVSAVAEGDLLRKVPLEVKGRPLEGEFLRLATIVNRMIQQLVLFTSEVTRVAREVGIQGKLGGQAQVPEVSGVWKDLTEDVNLMASNLTAQVRNISEVTIAVASGDLSKKITVDVHGEILQLKEIINTMVDQLRSFASEVTRVAREVGTEGKLGGQAVVPGVAGTWKDLTDSVNAMCGNLTAQVRNIADVTTAVARGDLSRKITVDVKGEILELKNTINTMVDQLNAFASEVTRVAREVGTDGKLGGQAEVREVSGIWKDLTENVNLMASNLTAQVRNIATVATAIARGDLSHKITVNVSGEILELKETINTMVDQLNAFAGEVTRVAREVGTEGRLGGQARVPGVAGTWKDLTDNVNLLAANLTTQVRNIADVTTAVARGDLSRKITVKVSGEILALKETINTMVDQLKRFASEVTRMAWEVGTEGKLGGQARVPGVAGTWMDLTDNVNVMAANLTEQVRGIVRVVTAVADGDLKQKLIVNAKGEVAALAETINNMTDTLATFAQQVTGVAREVGVEGRLGGQASVPGASGTWKDLTGNVNLLAANLTTQVRAIAEVATAVTKGDLTRSIQVEARGEVAELKDNINTMIMNLRLTTERNRQEDWVKTNFARVTNLLQGQRELGRVGQMLLSEIIPLVSAQRGVIYQVDSSSGQEALRLLASYAERGTNGLQQERLQLAESLLGQCAIEKRSILVTDVPQVSPIRGGTFHAAPRNVVFLPVLFENQVKAVMELATLGTFTPTHLAFLDQVTTSIGIVLNSIEATMKTEDLLKQSQQLAAELQAQQKELQEKNEQLALKAHQLVEQNEEVERKNEEVERARRALEDKADELALISKYKSEFLANMSHELRTPLNSILLLGQQMGENHEGNLTEKQVEFARAIYSAGSDLLNLINDILDLSKIESGTVSVDAEEIPFTKIVETMERTFRHEAVSRHLAFVIELDTNLPLGIITDSKRLMQVLKNLLSNSFKFTAEGTVQLKIYAASTTWNLSHRILSAARSVVAFEVSDTGIGIALDKQKVIFEAFQQGDASTNRRYGGTGLGLAICRELAMLLGGEIQLRSSLGQGAIFTLYLPLIYSGSAESVKIEIPPGPKTSTDRESSPVGKPKLLAKSMPDDRDLIEPGDSILLIVEDDPSYCRLLTELAHRNGFKVLVTMNGVDALSLARQIQPTAISLDFDLPDVSGWTILSQLKQDLNTRHIPVQMITSDEERRHGLARGAFRILTKPATAEELGAAILRIKEYAASRCRRLLLVQDEAPEQLNIRALLDHNDIAIETVGSGRQALAVLEDRNFDCIVLDLRLPDMSGYEVLEQLSADQRMRDLPIIVFTRNELTSQEDLRLQAMARSLVVRGVASPERLVDETSIFLHRVTSTLPFEMQKMIEQLYRSDENLIGKQVLIVDDDIRNIFALSSTLERRGMTTISATTGKEAVTILESNPEIAIVLVDIMMPEMDGYETMRHVREIPAFRRLPIIALTAKAMKGDRDKCLEAGASEYLAKPVNADQLLSALRMWLHR